MKSKFRGLIPCLALLMMSVLTTQLSAQNTKDEKIVKDGTVVSLQYTLTGEDGKVIESNKGKAPMKYTQGRQQMIPGLEKEVAGMKVGQEKHVKVKPEDAYGPVNPKAVQELPKEKIPADGQKPGAVLTATGPQGQVIQVKVKEVKEKTVVLDFNHPMAGKTLIFDVKVLDVQPAQAAALPAQPPQAAQPAQPAAPPKPAPAQPAQPK